MKTIISFYYHYLSQIIYFWFVFLLATTIVCGQENKKMKLSSELYTTEWQQVKEDDSKGLPKSALEKVNSIYKKAKADNNPGQVIKSILFKVKYIGQVEEEALAKAIEELQKEAETANSYTKPILHSMLGEIYWQYYQNNRYYIMQRTKTTDFKQTDLRTWDAAKIIESTISEYTKSVANIEDTKQIPIENYNAILNNEENPGYVPNGRSFRPTVYDFLAHRAVDFFTNQEHGIARPAETFELNDPAYFNETSSFIPLKIVTKDSMAYKYYALQILQELLRLHIADKDPAALIEIDLKRLYFVYSHSVVENKNSLYQKALEALYNKVQKSPISTDVLHAMASHWHSLEHLYYSSPTEENRWVSQKAYKLCETAIEQFPSSEGAQNCRSLQAKITAKSVGITMESNVIPHKSNLLLVNYKNLRTLYFKVYPINRSIMEKVKKEHNEYYNKHKVYVGYEEVLVPYFAKETPREYFMVNFAEEADYMEHRAEVKVPQLNYGQYLIIASTSPDLQLDKQATAYSFINSSNLTFLYKTNPDHNMEFYILNRTTGEPEEGVEVNLYNQTYNHFKSRYVIQKELNHTTDSSGYMFAKANKDYKNFFLTLKKGNDYFEPIDDYNNSSDYRNLPFYQSPYQKTEPYKQIVSKLFLDRAIYRPGQTIYFKGILVHFNDKNRTIKTNTKVQATLYDANHQQVSQLNLTTNEFGTYSGSFTAPTSGLTGQMSIYTDYDGMVSFSVEEYKRPKFAVEFDKVKGSYQLGDKVKVKAYAKAFSGANIDNAQVKYRVIRNARYPHWWSYYRGWYQSSPQMEIHHGISKTDEKGGFEIEFSAIPDKSIPKEPGISFTYQVFADVTDLNGETHSSSTFAYIGYTSLVLNIDVPEMLPLETSKPIDIRAENLNGEPEPAKGTVKIYQLQNPPHAYKPKKWNRPDRFIIPEDEYKKDFPNEVYKDEDNLSTWKKQKEVFSSQFDTEKEKGINFSNLSQWETGKYVIESFTKDRYGQEVKDIKYFTVFSKNQRQTIPSPAYSWIAPIQLQGEPGDVARIVVASSESVKMLLELEVAGESRYKRWLSLTNTSKLLSIPIKEEYRGNVSLYYAYIKDNQIVSGSHTIAVPYTNKELKINFETFRNKLQPGEKEEWRLKVTGSKSEQVVSEMLATLYDASLDTFRKNYWDFSIYPYYYGNSAWNNTADFHVNSFHVYQKDWNPVVYGTSKSYDSLNWFGVYLYNFRGFYPYQYRGYRNGGKKRAKKADYYEEDKDTNGAVMDDAPMAEKSLAKEDKKVAETTSKPAQPMKEREKGEAQTAAEPSDSSTKGGESGEISGVKARTNFNETAFFLPHLVSDQNGEITISFTIPEALTKWKMMGLAHTKDLKYGIISNELVTQKELMVVPNAPRFFREGDKMEFTSKITNLSDKKISGKAQIEFFDSITSNPIPIDKILGSNKLLSFDAEKGQSTLVKWNIQIPDTYSAITYRVVAKAESFSDGEEAPLPVLTNRMLVTETLPLPMRGKEPKKFQLAKMVNNQSKTLVHHKYTLEFTSNPVWYAVQALPYIMEYPYECSEQVFSRFYANSLASHIANSNPKIKKVFDIWKDPSLHQGSKDALLSNLEKNQELKSLVLEETPWVLDAQNETERKKRVGLLFDLAKMSTELEKALDKLSKNQSSNGGFAWFHGMKEDRYITQHIVTGLGHLNHLGVKNVRENSKAWNMATLAVQYLDSQIRTDYQYLLSAEKKDNLDMSAMQIGYLQIQYLYARSFFKDVPMSKDVQEAVEYYKWQSKTYWNSFLRNKILLGMLSLALHRLGEETPKAFVKELSSHKLKDFEAKGVPKLIVNSLKEHAITSEEMGMYWKQGWGYYWYELPIETQSLMVEVFDEIAKDEVAVNDLKTWLLKQKQTQDWKTTKATAEAIYALLLKGEDWLSAEQSVEIQLGNKKIKPSEDKDISPEVGTGYFKKSFSGAEISNDMGNITVTPINNNSKLANGGVSWGAVYWQYFEQLDKITPAETPLKLQKKLFLQENSNTGPVITPVTDKIKLKPGDLLKVRIELRVDREMEYVHLKDMRASALEPTNVISRYKWQDGLGYYESTRDAATNFFFDYLPKGTYVFEYPLRVTHNGDYSNGITTIQSMYAPEFSSHSEGVRIKVGE